MSMLSVKNLDEKAFNYAVITVTPEAQVTLRGYSHLKTLRLLRVECITCTVLVIQLALWKTLTSMDMFMITSIPHRKTIVFRLGNVTVFGTSWLGTLVRFLVLSGHRPSSLTVNNK